MRDKLVFRVRLIAQMVKHVDLTFRAQEMASLPWRQESAVNAIDGSTSWA